MGLFLRLRGETGPVASGMKRPYVWQFAKRRTYKTMVADGTRLSWPRWAVGLRFQRTVFVFSAQVGPRGSRGQVSQGLLPHHDRHVPASSYAVHRQRHALRGGMIGVRCRSLNRNRLASMMDPFMYGVIVAGSPVWVAERKVPSDTATVAMQLHRTQDAGRIMDFCRPRRRSERANSSISPITSLPRMMPLMHIAGDDVQGDACCDFLCPRMLKSGI